MMSDICWMTFNFHIAVIPVPAGLAACACDTRCRYVLPLPAVLRTALSVVAICCIHGVVICRTIRFSPNHSMRSAPCLSVIAGRRPAGIGRTGMHPVSSSHAVRCAGRRIYNHCKIFVKFNRYLCKYFQLWETRTHKSTFTQFSP